MLKFYQKIGVTRSAKPIFQPVNIREDILAKLTSAYSTNNNFDAYALFQYFLARELSTVGGTSPRLSIYEKISKFHLSNLDNPQLEICKRDLSIATIFDVIQFGKSRVDPILVSNGP